MHQQPRCPRLQSDDEDEEKKNQEAASKAKSDDAAAVAKAKEKESKKRAPSAAAALLSSTSKPIFLHDGMAQGGFDLPPDEDPVPKGKGEEEPQAKRQAVAPPAAAAAAASVPVPAAAPNKQAATSKKGGKPGAAGVDVKDKVKTQRMRGQSAHATWKSEGEMKLRQVCPRKLKRNEMSKIGT